MFVHPRYPVLCLSDLSEISNTACNPSLPVGLLSAVYALAAPFTFMDDELSVSKGYLQLPAEDLWNIAHRSFQRASRSSHLSLIQLGLLLLRMPPPNFAVAEPPSGWALSCSVLAMAESLGLNVDPSDWRLPQKEVRLRRRLWWLLIAEHTWQAVVFGRPSHLNESSWDVSPLSHDDFEGDLYPDDDVRAAIVTNIPLCLANCDLSSITADVLRDFW